MVIEKARRLIEHKRDVVILLDSITRLARAYNTVTPHSGRILTGGVDSTALQWPRRFFAAARNVKKAFEYHCDGACRDGQSHGRGHIRRI